jgi:hypothetical protein
LSLAKRVSALLVRARKFSVMCAAFSLVMETGCSHLIDREICNIQAWRITLTDAVPRVLAVLFLVPLAAGDVPEDVLMHGP